MRWCLDYDACMTEPFRRAEKLTEVARVATLEPLPLGDPRYVDLSAGRGTKELRQLRVHLEDQSAQDNRFAKVAFVGHRGCGKSTELLRLEQEMIRRFFPLHLYVDETLLRDLDYTDLLLWLVDSLTREFALKDMPLDPRLVDDVAEWFAEVAEEKSTALTTSLTAETELEGEAKLGFFAASLRILARLKSTVSGSLDRRQTIRSNLQRYSGDLIARVNGLLDNAARALETAGKEPDLLVVQDNLDRLSAEAARRLFIENGELLKDLRAHFIFTAPVALVMSPANLGRVFEHQFTMPMIKTHRADGKSFKPGLDALTELIGKRVDLERVFASNDVIRFLAQMSGGSVRDLMRLLDHAQLSARVDDKDRIDKASAREAVTKLRIDFERLLVPGQVYFPLLARIHRTKDLALEFALDQTAVQAARAFCADLLIMGAVLEYNGERCWYDAHPIVREIGPFKDGIGET